MSRQDHLQSRLHRRNAFDPMLMGILNVTPDSFSDGGDYYAVGRAVQRAMEMIFEGAEIIDIGGESTRPAGAAYGKGYVPISAEEEMHRVLPVIRELRERNDTILISIDTTKSAVAEAAIAAGADIVNDVSAATIDPRILGVAAGSDSAIVLMHGNGPQFMRSTIEEYAYGDVVGEVRSYLKERIAEAQAAGIRTVIADVGIGFAKTYEDNLMLLRRQDEFMGDDGLGVPMMLGFSRKSTIGRASGNLNAPPRERLAGSIAATIHAVQHGASIVRTHDVRPTVEALRVLQAIEFGPAHEEQESTVSTVRERAA